MNTKPIELTNKEVREIAGNDTIQEMWGAESIEEMIDIILTSVYAVKFKYHSATPGYVGDLYILQGDVLTGDPPVVLTRDRKRMLVFTNF